MTSFFFLHDYLEQASTNTKPSRWHWPTLSNTSQSSLSPPANTQSTSKSLPTSPIDAAFTNSSDSSEPATSLPKSTSVR